MEDFLTAAALFDEQEYSCGYNEGRLDADDVGYQSEARKMGFLKAYAISLETRFYKEIVKEPPSQVQSERIQKKIGSLIDAVDKIGTINDQALDYEEEVSKIRSTFKSLSGSTVVSSFSKIKDIDQKKSW